MSEGEFTAFLKMVFSNLIANSIDGSLHFVCMDWRHLYSVLTAGRQAYTDLKNVCVWAKTNGGMGSLYRSQHELVLVFKAGAGRHINNIALGKYGRNRSNLWTYPGANSFGAERDESLAMHPTVKPTALVADAIKDGTRRKHIVLDAFAGSGTTIIAAEKTGRRGYAMELDPRYVNVALRRWEALTGQTAVHAATGLSFNEMTAVRHGEPAGSSCHPRIRHRTRRASHVG